MKRISFITYLLISTIFLLTSAAFAMEKSESNLIKSDEILLNSFKYFIDKPACTNALLGLSQNDFIDKRLVCNNRFLYSMIALIVYKAFTQIVPLTRICTRFNKLLTPDNIALVVSDRFSEYGLCIVPALIKEYCRPLRKYGKESMNHIANSLQYDFKNLQYNSIDDVMNHFDEVMNVYLSAIARGFVKVKECA